jgi:hypothetical protein
MATNAYFSNYNNFNEQNLIDDLVIESIQIYGVDTYFVTRNLQSIDPIMNEDRLSIFNAAYHIEMYVKTVDGFEGEGDFLSKFGLQIRDQVTFTVAIRTFERHVIALTPTINRPLEGDLVYLPMNNKFFKIMHVEHESVFYQSGALQVYDLKCELFEYSNERFATGIADIDNHYAAYETDGIENLEQLENRDPGALNLNYEEKANEVIDFGEIDPFTEVIFPPSDYFPRFDDDQHTIDNDTLNIDEG